MSTPIPIESFTTKTNKVDLVDAAHINDLQDSVVMLETALTDLLNTDGTLISGSSFPGSPFSTQLFYRTDLEKWYIRNFANTNWLELTGSLLSNVVFHWTAGNDSQSADGNSGYGFGALGGNSKWYIGQSYNAAEGNINAFFSKFYKIAGVNTLTAYFKGDHAGASGAQLAIRVDSTTGSYGTCGSSFGWASTTFDVSGLTNDTVYDLCFNLRHNGGAASGGTSYSAIIVFAS